MPPCAPLLLPINTTAALTVTLIMHLDDRRAWPRLMAAVVLRVVMLRPHPNRRAQWAVVVMVLRAVTLTWCVSRPPYILPPRFLVPVPRTGSPYHALAPVTIHSLTSDARFGARMAAKIAPPYVLTGALTASLSFRRDRGRVRLMAVAMLILSLLVVLPLSGCRQRSVGARGWVLREMTCPW